MLTRDAGKWHAVWYRHWLEHAGAALVALGVAASLCASYGVSVYLGRDPFVTHIRITVIGAWLLPLFLHGTGIRTNDLQPGHASLYYTLTLPVPRFRLVWTRFVVAGMSAVLLQTFIFGVNVATLTLLGYPGPHGAMAAGSALAMPIMLTAVAAIGLMNIWDDRLGLLGLLLAYVFVMLVGFGWQGTAGLIGSVTVPWTTVAAMGVAVLASVALTMFIARTRDF